MNMEECLLQKRPVLGAMSLAFLAPYFVLQYYGVGTATATIAKQSESNAVINIAGSLTRLLALNLVAKLLACFSCCNS